MAVRVLERVERTRAYADLSLHNAMMRADLSSADRALCTELVYGTLRWRGRIDFALSQFLDRDFDRLEAGVASALRLGAYQLLFTDRIPESAAVDQAVRCVRSMGAERATGLVNAVLRRLAAARDALPIPDLADDPEAHLVHGLSLPPWIARLWIEQFGPEQAEKLARTSNASPPLCVRVNRTRSDRDALLSELRERFPEVERCRLAEGGLTLGRKGNPGHDPAFLAGLYTVQDEASQLVVQMLDPRPGDRVLDTCAAPGTKATAIAERVGEDGEVVALDRHPRRLALVGRDARRLGLANLRTIERDASRSLMDLVEKTDGASELDGGPFDRVLVDAPCSGLGTLRRNPDARWRVQPEDTLELADLQRRILGRGASVLRVGGRLVYSTCTLVPDENERVVADFLSDAPAFRRVGADELPASLAPLLDADAQLRCLPHLHDTDGFFAACLERVE
ncbi:MAG: 16S rRNA (cytosine(967)-C(5))-methyltransferase RsmB [Myxococcota bacterium]